MNEGILGAIANPQLADVAGALNYRQSVMDRDEQKRKEITRNKLIAQAIPNMAEDSPIRKLFETDPQAGAMMAKSLGIPLNDGERFEQLRNHTRDLAMLAENDPREALNHALSIQADNQRNGVKDEHIDNWIALADKDPVTAFNGLHVMDQNLNPAKPDYEMMKVNNESRRIDQAEKFKSADLSLEQQKLELERQKMLQGKAPKPLAANDIQGIQKDVSALLKDTNDIHRAAKSLESLKDRGTPLAQTASVFAFMKSLDPTSAVRETEQGQVYDAQGAAAGVAAKLNKMIGEGGLTKEGFQDIVDTSKALANSAIDSSAEQINPYLETYGETLPSEFKQNIASRIPKKFEIGSSKTPKLSGQDKQAYDWAKANPDDPRSMQILNKLGAQ